MNPAEDSRTGRTSTSAARPLPHGRGRAARPGRAAGRVRPESTRPGRGRNAYLPLAVGAGRTRGQVAGHGWLGLGQVLDERDRPDDPSHGGPVRADGDLGEPGAVRPRTQRGEDDAARRGLAGPGVGDAADGTGRDHPVVRGTRLVAERSSPVTVQVGATPRAYPAAARPARRPCRGGPGAGRCRGRSGRAGRPGRQCLAGHRLHRGHRRRRDDADGAAARAGSDPAEPVRRYRAHPGRRARARAVRPGPRCGRRRWRWTTSTAPGWSALLKAVILGDGARTTRSASVCCSPGGHPGPRRPGRRHLARARRAVRLRPDGAAAAEGGRRTAEGGRRTVNGPGQTADGRRRKATGDGRRVGRGGPGGPAAVSPGPLSPPPRPGARARPARRRR